MQLLSYLVQKFFVGNNIITQAADCIQQSVLLDSVNTPKDDDIIVKTLSNA